MWAQNLGYLTIDPLRGEAWKEAAPADFLRTREGSPRTNQRKLVISKATLEKLVRDQVEHLWASLGA